MRYIKTRPKSQSAFKVALRRSPLPFCSSFETKKNSSSSSKKERSVVKARRPKCLCAQAKGVCVYVQSRDNFDCLYFFVVSFYYPFFFVWGKKRFDVGVFISWDKKTIVVVVQKVAAFEREKKKNWIHYLFFTRFIKPLPPVLLVFKKDDDDDFDDDNNALSSSV
jgi:hypothetical protein